MTAKNADSIALALALAAVLAGGGGTVIAEVRSHKPHQISAATAGQVWRAEPVSMPDPSEELQQEWASPRSQSRGPEWVYDLFTPPEIRFDGATRMFAVKPPEDPARAEMTAPGVELVGVKRAPFRLQLLGFLGDDGHFVGVFENRRTAEVFLAGTGKLLPDLELRVAEFSVNRASRVAEGMLVPPWVATAQVHDLHADSLTTLTAGELSLTDELSAVFATQEDDDETIGEYWAGEELESADRVYRVSRLRFDPPMAELTQVSAQLPQRFRLGLAAHQSLATGTVAPAN